MGYLKSSLSGEEELSHTFSIQMKIFRLITGSVVFGLIVTASLMPKVTEDGVVGFRAWTEERMKYRHFGRLEQAGLARFESYKMSRGGGVRGA